MSDERPLFKGTRDPADEGRAILRSHYGYDAEKVTKLSVGQLQMALDAQTVNRQLAAMARSGLQGWVDEGRLDASVLDLSADEALELWKLESTIDRHHAARGEEKAVRRPVDPSKARPPAAPPPFERHEFVNVLSDFVAILAAQQAEIDELRNELATTKSASLAMFGKQQVIEQLTTVERDFKGFEATIEIEEQATHTSESQHSESIESSSSDGDARDTSPAIKGLASYVAGLDVSRAVNVTAMNRKVAKLSESSKRRAQVKIRGAMTLKIGEISGGKKGG